ncbi:hypothetical protein PATA110615_31660 [Paenibacillus taichungensis]
MINKHTNGHDVNNAAVILICPATRPPVNSCREKNIQIERYVAPSGNEIIPLNVLGSIYPVIMLLPIRINVTNSNIDNMKNTIAITLFKMYTYFPDAKQRKSFVISASYPLYLEDVIL